MFIDEVGTSALKCSTNIPNERYLGVTGIITKSHIHERRFQPAIDQLKSDLFGHSANNPIILHRREIIRKERKFEVLNDAKIKAEFDARFLDMVDKFPYLVITSVIDKKEHLEKYTTWQFDPYHYALRCLVERYILWLRRHNYQGDVCVEARFKKVDKKLKASFREIYDHGTEHIPERIVKKHLLSHDLILYNKAANIAGLQFCDLLAHPSARNFRLTKEGAPIPQDFGTSIVKILEEKKYMRNPQTRQIMGWGKKWLP